MLVPCRNDSMLLACVKRTLVAMCGAEVYTMYLPFLSSQSPLPILYRITVTVFPTTPGNVSRHILADGFCCDLRKWLFPSDDLRRLIICNGIPSYKLKKDNVDPTHGLAQKTNYVQWSVATWVHLTLEIGSKHCIAPAEKEEESLSLKKETLSFQLQLSYELLELFPKASLQSL